jgi:hypothetical protein
MPFDFSVDQVVELGGHKFEINAFPGGSKNTSEARWVVEGVFDAVDTAAPNIMAIRKDPRYSDIGRAEKIDPLVAGVFDRLVIAWNNLESYTRSIEKRESTLINVPPVDPQNVVAHFRAQEIRQAWNALDTAGRFELMSKLGESSEEIAFAILKSPIPQAGEEVKYFAERWADIRREANPQEAAAIKLAKDSTEWATRNLNLVGVAAKPISGWAPERILKHVITTQEGRHANVAHHLGFAKDQVTREQIRLQQKAA